MCFFSHLLTQAAKHKTPSNPKLAWMMPAGSGMAVNEKFASAWSWKSVPFTPLIVPISGVTFGAAPPARPVKIAEGLTWWNGVTSDELKVI